MCFYYKTNPEKQTRFLSQNESYQQKGSITKRILTRRCVSNTTRTLTTKHMCLYHQTNPDKQNAFLLQNEP